MRKLLFLLFLPLAAHATTWYVTPGGSNSNPCTQVSPCATPDHAFNTVAAAGDTVLVAVGTYSYGGSGIIFNTAGTSGHPITVTCASRGACKLTNTVTGNSTVVEMNNNYQVLDGFEITNTGAGNNLGVYVTGHDVSLTRNVIHDIQTDCTSTGGGGIQIAVAALANIVIDSNTVYNISWVSGAPKCPSTTVQTDGILAENTGGNALVENNLVYNVSGGWGIGTSALATIVNNTIFNTVNGGIVMNNSPSGNVATNNIIVYTGLQASDSQFYGGACAIQNGTASTTTYGHNELAGNHGGNYGTGFGCSGSGLNTGDIAIDPALGTLFVNWQQNGSGNYQEIAGAATVGAGTATNAPTHDFRGDPRPNAFSKYDMGAYQLGNDWYIRSDGGNTSLCTGLANAAYPGSGTGVACAFNDIYDLVNPSTGAWSLLGAGDTIHLVSSKGPFYVGQTLNGLGTSKPFCVGAEQECVVPIFPDNVKVTGDSTTALASILGLNGVFWVFSTQGTTGVTIDNVDISQPTTCTQTGVGNSSITHTSLTGNVATYNWTYNSGTPLVLGESISVSGTTNGGGIFNVTKQIITGGTNLGGNPSPGATGTFTVAITSSNVAGAADTGTTAFGGLCRQGVDNYAQNGIMFSYLTNQGASNLTMDHVNVHGVAHDGFWGSHFNTNPNQTVNISNVILAGNGLNNWDSDSGGCGTACEAQGTMNMSNVTSSWSGAAEVHPNGGTIGGNGYNYAVDQQYNGAGDCIVMIATAGNWNWSNVNVDHCMQDGIDFLHMQDDLTVDPVVNTSNIFANMVEGQTYKIGAQTGSGTNVVGTGSCNWPFDASFPLNPPGWNALLGQTCRASDGMAFAITNTSTLNLNNIDNITMQSTAWDFAAVASDCTSGCAVNMRNVVTMGFTGNPNNPGVLPGGIFYSTTLNPFTNGTMSHTQWFNTKIASCPTMPNTVSCTYGDPQFTAESSINAMNIVPASGSPLIGAGVTYTGIPANDVFGVPYSSPPPIGAAMAGGAVTVAQPTCTPVPSTYGVAQTVTCSTVTSGATICGTTNGATPTSSPAGTCSVGTSGPFSISVTSTLKAIGTKAGATDSSVFSGLYTITPSTGTTVSGKITISGSGVKISN